MYDEIARNKRRTVVLLGAMTLLLTLVMGVPLAMSHAGWGGLVAGLVAAALVVAVAYRFSGRLALALGGARRTTREEYPRLFNLVEGLCISGGVPMPAIYLVQDDALNAFATGRNPRNGAIAVTSGLLARMNRAELEGVLAHELSHIRNYDTLVSTAAVVLAGAVGLVSRNMVFGSSGQRRSGDGDSGLAGILLFVISLVIALLAPVLAQLLRYAISRNRETLADACAAELTRYPPGLIAALAKIRDTPTAPSGPRIGSAAIAHLWFNAPEGASFRERRYATHPPIDERIAALQQL